MHAQVKSFIEENVVPLENELVERSMDPKLKWTHHPRLDELKVGRYTCNISHEMCTWFSCAFVCLLRMCNCKEWIPVRETNARQCECILSWASGKLTWASEIFYRTYNEHLFSGECSRNLVSHTGIPMVYLPVSFRVTSLPLGQPYIAPCSAIEITLKNKGKFDQYQATTKHDRVETLCVIFGVWWTLCD